MNRGLFCPFLGHDEVLDKAYLKSLGLSSSQIKKYIKKDDLSAYYLPESKTLSLPIDLINRGYCSPIYKGPSYRLLKEDEKYLVLAKPAGSHCFSHKYSDENNAHNFLRSIGKGKYFYHFPRECEDKGGLYRLDYETSGVLVFAKTQKNYEMLLNNRSHSFLKKIYRAKVKGELSITGPITHYLRPFGPKGQKVVATDSHLGKKCELTLESCQYHSQKNYTEVLISLGTGHRHQIRVQMKELGHPILGDPLYGNGQSFKRMYLHAETYEILDRDGIQRFHFAANESQGWNDFL